MTSKQKQLWLPLEQYLVSTHKFHSGSTRNSSLSNQDKDQPNMTSCMDVPEVALVHPWSYLVFEIHNCCKPWRQPWKSLFWITVSLKPKTHLLHFHKIKIEVCELPLHVVPVTIKPLPNIFLQIVEFSDNEALPRSLILTFEPSVKLETISETWEIIPEYNHS